MDGIISGKRFFTDATVVSPIAPSHLKTARRTLAVVEARERPKSAHYDPGALELKGQFFPMGLESTGGMSKNCSLAIAAMVQAGKDAHTWAPHEVVHGIKASVSVAVQRGTASIVAIWSSLAVSSRVCS